MKTTSEKMEAIRSALRAKLSLARPKLIPADPPPRYDAVFRTGVAALDTECKPVDLDAKICKRSRSLTPAKKVLLQTHVSSTTDRRFRALAKVAGHTKAGYLRNLVERHVAAVAPKLLQALNRLPESEG